MEKTSIIFLILISVVNLVSGCTKLDSSTDKLLPGHTQNIISTTVPTERPTKPNYQFKDDEYYLVHYIYPVDLCLPEFAFTDATKITTEDLYMFFCYIVDYEKLFNYKDWFDQKEQKYHVPVLVIEPTLKKYLNIESVDVSSIEGYDKSKNEINSFIAGWGGNRIAKIIKKEYLGNNSLKLTATFYSDEACTKALRTNVYVLQIDSENDKNYKYLSIEHNISHN